MMANRGSFAQRMASQAFSTTTTVENWDDDPDLQGDLFTNSRSSTVHSMSSRHSICSDSNAGDDDWQVLMAPTDDVSTKHAITQAMQAGVPIPANVPPSALVGGAIQRLGKKKSTKKVELDDDWGADLELPAPGSGGLKLKPRSPIPITPADDKDFDMDDWGEGSLGIRFGGTRRELRGGRSSTASAISPSIGSCVTFESEEDDLTGLVLPEEPLDFNSRLEKLKKTEYLPTPDASPLPQLQKREPPPTSVPALQPAATLQLQPAPQLSPVLPLGPSAFPPSDEEDSFYSLPDYMSSPPAPVRKPLAEDEDEDFISGLEIPTDEIIDTKKLTLNRNLVVKKNKPKPAPSPAARPSTTITFTDKPTVSRIPRPLPPTRSRLTPVYESGAPAVTANRQPPTTTSAQLLRAKRSAPVLRQSLGSVQRQSAPFVPAGSSIAQSHHAVTKSSSQTHMRRDSDARRPLSPTTRRPLSPTTRTYSRLSGGGQADPPSRSGLRHGMTSLSAAVAPEPSSKRRGPLGRPVLKKVHGDGTELEIFDDLPISSTKEKQFEKQPKNVPARPLRHLNSNSRLPTSDRLQTPVPQVAQVPKSPPKVDNTPRFARDTAASRNAREQRLGGPRSRNDGLTAPVRDWKAQIAARSPHASPMAQRKRGLGNQPVLIRAMSAPKNKGESPLVTSHYRCADLQLQLKKEWCTMRLHIAGRAMRKRLCTSQTLTPPLPPLCSPRPAHPRSPLHSARCTNGRTPSLTLPFQVSMPRKEAFRLGQSSSILLPSHLRPVLLLSRSSAPRAVSIPTGPCALILSR